MKCKTFVLWCLFSMIAKSNENVCFDTIQHLLTKGRIVNGNSIWESKTNDVVECAQLCVRLKKCKSFNFHDKSRLCQINSGLGTEATFDGNVVHSDISIWPNTIYPNCYGRPCAMDEVCSPGKTTNETTCSYSCLKFNDRKCPQPEGTMSSQPRTVESIYTHRCGHGTVGGDSAICLPSGKWNKTIDTTCTPIHGMSCLEDPDCEPIQGVCTGHVCRCKPGSQYDETAMTCEEVCGKDWVRFKEKCYLFGDRKVDISEAREFCEQKDGQLVQVDSEEENTFLKGFMINKPEHQSYWNDLYQTTVNGEERWYTTDERPTFTDWRTGEPNDMNRVGHLADLLAERCTTFQHDASFKWCDTGCLQSSNIPLCQKTARNK